MKISVCCPYYRYETKTAVVCEEISKKGGKVRLYIGNGKAVNMYVRDMCSLHFRECGIYKILEKTYDDAGNKKEI